MEAECDENKVVHQRELNTSADSGADNKSAICDLSDA